MTDTMNTDELLRTIRTADVMVMVDGQLGYISTAVLIENVWSFFVLDDVTRKSLGSVDVPVGGSIEVVGVNG